MAPESSIKADVNWKEQRHLAMTGTLEKPGLIKDRGNSPTQPRAEATALLTGLLLVLLQGTALCMDVGLLGISGTCTGPADKCRAPSKAGNISEQLGYRFFEVLLDVDHTSATP